MPFLTRFSGGQGESKPNTVGGVGGGESKLPLYMLYLLNSISTFVGYHICN